MNLNNRPPVCFIIGAGDCISDAPRLLTGDLLICADGGYLTARRLGLSPSLLIGDFDSLGEPPTDLEAVVRLPVEKDITDTEAAMREGERRGYRTFVLLGCTGGRPDHTYAAEQLLVGASLRGVRAFLVGESYTAFAVSDGSASFAAGASGTVSVFAARGEASGVTLRGLKYPLSSASLTPDAPLGVSNAFLPRVSARIEVASGSLLVFTLTENLIYLDF